MAIGKSKLHKMLQNASKLSETNTWYFAFTTELKEQILDWIREDQLEAEGIDGDGNVIGYYSLVTSFINPTKKFNTHYTLNDTGEFFRSMFVRVYKDQIVVDANPNKGDDNLFDLYGTKILKLTDENLEKLKTRILEHYRKEFSKIFQVN